MLDWPSFDCVNKVIVSLGADLKTRVYVLDAWPATLGNPVFSPSTVKGLKGNTVSVRLTGQDGEPCPGWWVHWILAAAPGPSGPYWLAEDLPEQDRCKWLCLERVLWTR